MYSPPLWRQIQRENFTNLSALLSFLSLEETAGPPLEHRPSFPLNVPRRLAEKMRKGDWQDPLLRQFLPLAKLNQIEGFSPSPTQEERFRSEKKLLQKYEGRALLLATGSCPMNCRFCFRQNFPYETEKKGFEEELASIAADPSIFEVILSGGDPLSLSNESLSVLLTKLDEIPHVTLLRIHTRFPIGIPERIDAGLRELFAKTRLQTYFVIHSNHPSELDEQVIASLLSLRDVGVTLLHQAVLLRGVNDRLETLLKLYKHLTINGIVPYYLHQLDRIAGSEHFEVERERGEMLIEQLMTVLPGYAVPRYVEEIAGKPCKTPIKTQTKTP